MKHFDISALPAMDQIPKLEGAFSPEISVGPSSGATNLATVDDVVLRRWMADATMGVDGADAKLAAAYLMGNITAALAEIVTGLALRSHCLTAAAPSAVALVARFVPWAQDGENGVSLVFDMHLSADGLMFENTVRPYEFAKAIEDILSPLVRTLSNTSGLSKAALFRLAGDSLAYAFLAHGKILGREGEAMALAYAVLRAPTTALTNKQVHFDFIALPEAPHIGEWLRVRGGCCRAYTRPGFPEHCTTCVLRDKDSRTQRYRDYLRNAD
ncbi:MAG: hypothetical protein ACSHW1_15325 [Yoonia sp.]|uniref:hypothetical protein n=1 Tax=Yoonia sp. TaxID=2212373 RepID=UPI003EF8DFA2